MTNIRIPRASRGDRVRRYLARLFLGLCVIGVGVGYLGNYVSFLPWEHFTLFFPGWGSLFLIIPAICGLIRKPLSWFWPICLLGGVLILLSQQENFKFSTAAAIVLAAFIILIGIRIILSPLFGRMRRRQFRRKWGEMTGGAMTSFGDTSGGSTSDRHYSVRFGDRRVRIADEEFTSGTVECAFGDMNFDISGAVINGCAVIDASCSFGDLDIIIPAGAVVELTSTQAFGDVSNRHQNPTSPDAPVIYINATCSFGELCIR